MSFVGNFTWKWPRGFLTRCLLTATSFPLCISPLTCSSPNRSITLGVFFSQFYNHQVCFFPLRKALPMGECWETQTEWETVGMRILNAWVPGRSVRVIHSVALCRALSHELVLENKEKVSFFFLTNVSLGAGGTSSPAWRTPAHTIMCCYAWPDTTAVVVMVCQDTPNSHLLQNHLLHF